jgi:hypothetical protein
LTMLGEPILVVEDQPAGERHAGLVSP